MNDRTLAFVAQHAAVGYARTLAGFDDDALCDIETAVGEALANAIEPGQGDARCINLMCGRGFDMEAHTAPGCIPERGYGIPIMRSTMDQVEFSAGGMTVNMLKRFRYPPMPARKASV